MQTNLIYLTGYRGTGKSTIGQQLATALGCPCLDLDAEIERRAGKPITSIFADGGEQAFRDLETTCLNQIVEKTVSDGDDRPKVVALGGGAILREENRRQIATSGVCVWLTATAETLVERLQADETTKSTRPPLTELSPAEEIRQLLNDREPLYRDSADFCVSTDDRAPEEITRAVLDWLQARLRPGKTVD